MQGTAEPGWNRVVAALLYVYHTVLFAESVEVFDRMIGRLDDVCWRRLRFNAIESKVLFFKGISCGSIMSLEMEKY